MLAGVDVRELDARKFTNLIHAILSQGLDPGGLADLDKWINEDNPARQLRQETPEETQERLRPTWGTTAEAVAGQDAMIALVQGAR